VRGKREHPRHNGDEIDSARRTARQQPLRPGESAGSQSVMVSVNQSVTPFLQLYRIHKVQAAPACAPPPGSEAAGAPAAAALHAPNTPWNTRPARASCSPGPGRLSGSRGLSRGCPLPLSETGKPGAGPGGRPFRVWYFMQLISWTESFAVRRPSHARRHPGSCDQQYG
jgi:hypothetical protein